MKSTFPIIALTLICSFTLNICAAQVIPAIKEQPAHPLKLTVTDSQPILRIAGGTVAESDLPNLLQNYWPNNINEGKPNRWYPLVGGYELAPNAGPRQQNAIMMQRTADSPAMGIGQNLTLNQEQPQTISISGQSKAQNVSGNQNKDYSLYMDVIYQDGTPQWGVSQPFATGTHDWQLLHFVFAPEKPIKSVSFYALFRGVHTGQVWFCDLTLKQLPLDGTPLSFDGGNVTALRTTPPHDAVNLSTTDGLSVKVDRSNGAALALSLNGKEQEIPPALAGFTARDVANKTSYHPLVDNNFDALKLGLQKDIKSTSNAITISGQLRDQSGRDRAVSLVYAIPLDAVGWQWGDDISHSRTILTGQECSNATSIGSISSVGANGGLSRYPLAALWKGDQGIALCLDMNQAAQFRVAYNAALKCLYIVYDMGMTSEKPQANFRFVLYRFDGNWGYRAAVAKMYTLFPELFEVRGAAKKQGLWMPFSKIQDVQGWQDFGFRFREADYNADLAWDDAHDILTFRYSEPSTWWMPMAQEMPRDYQTALQQAQSYLGQNNENGKKAEALLNSGMRRADGTLAVQFRNEPWTNGAVWNFNTLPGLRGPETGATLVWNDARRAQYAGNVPYGELDGEYLDSIEAYGITDMDFDRDHFAASTVPLTFDAATQRPGIYKALMIYELARGMCPDLKAMGKYMFANGAPRNYCFLAPWFDAMGTEINWLQGNKFTPSNDQEMNLWRTMAAQKAYCLLQNTDLEAFGPYVEKYFQRSLFYGIFPGFFSADASTNRYWKNPAWYNRDRALFKKYIPLIQDLSAAGWQPVTLARSDNPQVRLERFGRVPGDQYAQEDAPHLYLTAMNISGEAQRTTIKMEDAIKPQENITELISEKVLLPEGNSLEVTLQPGQVMLLQLR